MFYTKQIQTPEGYRGAPRELVVRVEREHSGAWLPACPMRQVRGLLHQCQVQHEGFGGTRPAHTARKPASSGQVGHKIFILC